MAKHAREDESTSSEPMRKRLNSNGITKENQLANLLTNRYEDIQRIITGCLDTKSVLALSSTNREIRWSIRANDWNINAKLSRFVDQPTTFRTYLGRHNGLLSGSFALQFFERVTWKDSDLDLFFDLDSGYEEMVDYLVTQEGYVVQEPSKDDHSYSHWDSDLAESGMTADQINMETPFKVKTLLRDKAKIQFILCKTSALYLILRQFYTTALTNIITWNAAYSLFPRTTFLKHETFPLKPLDAYFGNLHAKYSQRGWRMKTPTKKDPHPLQHHERLHMRSAMLHQLDDLVGMCEQPEYIMRVGGKTTWRMALATDLVQRPKQPDSVIEAARYHLNLSVRLNGRSTVLSAIGTASCYRIGAMLFRSHIFQWTHLVCLPTDTETLGAITEHITAEQSHKLKSDVQQSLFEEWKPFWQYKFEKPKGW